MALTRLFSSWHGAVTTFLQGQLLAGLGPLKLREEICPSRQGIIPGRPRYQASLVATPCTHLVISLLEKDQGASGSDATTASWLASWSFPPPKLSTFFHPQFLASFARSKTKKPQMEPPGSVLCRSCSTRTMRLGRSARP
jgi:hypothetical protein